MAWAPICPVFACLLARHVQSEVSNGRRVRQPFENRKMFGVPEGVVWTDARNSFCGLNHT